MTSVVLEINCCDQSPPWNGGDVMILSVNLLSLGYIGTLYHYMVGF